MAHAGTEGAFRIRTPNWSGHFLWEIITWRKVCSRSGMKRFQTALALTQLLLAAACSGKFEGVDPGQSGGAPSVGSGGTPGLNCAVVDCKPPSPLDGICPATAIFSPCCGWSDGDCGKPVVIDCHQVACAPVAPRDGICKESAPSACCGWTDADCPQSPIMCELCAPQIADGVCSHAVGDCCRDADPDCSPACANVACPASPFDGVCTQKEPIACCGYTDPDCKGLPACSTLGCPAFAQLPDGVCTQAAPDRCCGFSDPDCRTLYNCDVSKVTCQTFAAVQCPPGNVPTEANLCYGPCVPRNQCLPGTVPLDCSLVDCATSAGPSPADGFCTDPNPKLDCCGLFDQDCANVVTCRNIACAAISEVSDGVCERAFDDCCRTQDPDCSSVGGLIPPQRVCLGSCAIPLPDGVCVRYPDNCCGRSDPDCVN